MRLDYAMTLMNMVAAYKMAANGGEFRSVEMGVCGTKADQDGISLRCKQIGRTQFCYSATVYEADGLHNPVVTKCAADYRAYVPGFTNALGFLGVDLPLRDRGGLARYPVGASDLDRSYLLIKVYASRGHFRQTRVRARI